MKRPGDPTAFYLLQMPGGKFWGTGFQETSVGNTAQDESKINFILEGKIIKSDSTECIIS